MRLLAELLEELVIHKHSHGALSVGIDVGYRRLGQEVGKKKIVHAATKPSNIFSA
jgi:hypothetical protein